MAIFAASGCDVAQRPLVAKTAERPGSWKLRKVDSRFGQKQHYGAVAGNPAKKPSASRRGGGCCHDAEVELCSATISICRRSEAKLRSTDVKSGAIRAIGQKTGVSGKIKPEGQLVAAILPPVFDIFRQGANHVPTETALGQVTVRVKLCQGT